MKKQTAKQEAVQQAQDVLRLKPLYLDTETTGFGPKDEVVEIAIVNFDGQVLFDSLVKPTIRIPNDAIKVHNITNPMVAEAPAWTELWPTVQEVLAGQALAIYNAEFDLRLLQQSNRKNDLPWSPPYKKDICIMHLYARYYGDWNDYHQSYRWQRLEQAAKQCRIPLPQTHRAKDDALLARALLHAMAGENPPEPQ